MRTPLRKLLADREKEEFRNWLNWLSYLNSYRRGLQGRFRRGRTGFNAILFGKRYSTAAARPFRFRTGYKDRYR